jgi:hypothetical protein
MNNIQETRAAIKQAVTHLVARQRCTPREARKRIYQRARAKKAELGQVARMIVAEHIAAHHDHIPSITRVPERMGPDA